MAYASEIRAGRNGSFGDRVQAVITAFRKSREQRRAYKRTFDELSNLSSRDLDDLGITAAEIPFIAREAANSVN